MSLLATIWNGIRQLAGLVIPFFAQARDFRQWDREVRWLLRLLIILIVLIALFVLNHVYEEQVRNVLLVPDFATALWGDVYRVWLPLLFLLFIGFLWAAWWLWKILTEEDLSHFPDIDLAWQEAVEALNKEGMDLRDLPLYLVHGQPKGGEEAFLKAGELDWKTFYQPRRDAPLHVYATRDAIFVTCPGASILGRVAELLHTDVVTMSTPDPTVTGGGAGAIDKYKTVAAGGNSAAYGPAFQQIIAIIEQARREGREPNDEEKQRIQEIEKQDPAPKARKGPPSLAPMAKELVTHAARLRHFCRLVARDRKPYCPINGAYLLVPLAAAEGDANYNQVAAYVEQELSIAREILQVACPLLLLVCDWETLPGFNEFVKGMEERDRDARKRRWGQRYVMLPAVEDPTKRSQKLEQTLRWTFAAKMTNQVYKLFKLEQRSQEEYAKVVRENGLLYRFLHAMREREKRLAHLIAHGVVPRSDEGPFVIGCYLAGTGKAPREQAFIPGAIRKLLECRGENVVWTRAGFAEETSYRAWTKIGYVACSLIALGCVAFLAWRLYNRS